MDIGSKSVNWLVENGLISLDQPKRWARRITRERAKASASLQQAKANQAVAYWIGKNWKPEQEYRVKSTELALAQYGITRRQLEVAMRELQKLGKLENNKDSVSNNCHVKWKKVSLESDVPTFGVN